MSLTRLKSQLIAAVVLALSCAIANGPEEPAAKVKPKPAAAKAAAAEAKSPAAGGQGVHPADIGPAEDPVVAALLASNPTTPAEIFHTAQLLLEASRPELAKKYLRKLLDAKLDDGQWSALVDEFHTTAFTDLAERTELRPENEQLLRAALAGADRQLRDPARMAEEVKQLQDPSSEVRARAIAKLQRAHAAAVGALIAVLADPQRAGEHRAVRAALAAMRGDAIDPLAEIIQRADAALAIQAIQTLAEMRATQAIVYLYAPALAAQSNANVRAAARAAIMQLQGDLPTPEQAAQQLDDLARSYYAGKQSLSTDLHGRMTLWSWDAAARQCVARSYLPEDAARAFAARLARAAEVLSPENRAARTLAVAAELEQLIYDRGLEKKLDFDDVEVKRLAASNPRVMEEVLAFCLNEHHPAGARAAAEILGHSGKSQALLQGGAGPSPLVRAVRSFDARLRMAALEAITALQPTSPFSGSSFVLEALAFQSASTGGRRALAVSPSTAALEEWIGVLKFRNIEADAAVSGGEALRMAWRCPDYELAVIDMATQSPPAEEIVQQLRQDYRTAGLRIALVARSGFLKRAQRIAQSDRLTLAFSKPIDATAARWQFAQISALAPREFVGFSERQELAVRSLDCLAKLSDTAVKGTVPFSRPPTKGAAYAGDPRKSGQSPARRLFDIQKAEDAVLAGLLVPRLSGHAIIVLANIGTRASQQALAEVASRAVNPVPLRQSAAVAFNLNVQQFGVLLSQASIRWQYRRYRQSADEDTAAQAALASLLTAIESRATPSMLEAARNASVPEKKEPQPKKRIAN